MYCKKIIYHIRLPFITAYQSVQEANQFYRSSVNNTAALLNTFIEGKYTNLPKDITHTLRLVLIGIFEVSRCQDDTTAYINKIVKAIKAKFRKIRMKDNEDSEPITAFILSSENEEDDSTTVSTTTVGAVGTGTGDASGNTTAGAVNTGTCDASGSAVGTGTGDASGNTIVGVLCKVFSQSLIEHS